MILVSFCATELDGCHSSACSSNISEFCVTEFDNCHSSARSSIKTGVRAAPKRTVCECESVDVRECGAEALVDLRMTALHHQFKVVQLEDCWVEERRSIEKIQFLWFFNGCEVQS